MLERFPPSSGLDVNMMPFRMGDSSSLPEHLEAYWPLIEACNLPPEVGPTTGSIYYRL